MFKICHFHHSSHPTVTQPSNNAASTSIRRHDVASTLMRRWIDVVCLLGTFWLKWICSFRATFFKSFFLPLFQLAVLDKFNTYIEEQHRAKQWVWCYQHSPCKAYRKLALADPEISTRGNLTTRCSVINVCQIMPYEPPSWVGVSTSISKHETYNFSGGGGSRPPVPSALDPRMIRLTLLWRNGNGVDRTLKKLRTPKGNYWIKQWFSSMASLFKMGTSLRGKNLLPEGANSFLYSMENYFNHIKWPPLNVTIFITHVPNLRNGRCANEKYWVVYITKIKLSWPLSDKCLNGTLFRTGQPSGKLPCYGIPTSHTHFSTFLPHVYIKNSLYPLPLHTLVYSTDMSRASKLDSLIVCDVSFCVCHFPIWCLGSGHSGVVLDCISSWYLPSSLFLWNAYEGSCAWIIF